MINEPMLIASGITKRYGGVAALTDAGFQLNKGEILGLCGENGAGKSTLIKILGGIVTPDSGSLSIDGAAVHFGHRPDPSLLSIVHQELSIIPHLSVLDNIMMGRRGAGGFYFRRSFETETRDLLQQVGLQHVQPTMLAGKLTLAEQQLIEIARGLASNSRVLLLDEPTATLSDAEINKVFAVLRQLRERGASIVIVSHRLAEVFSLTDRITVFRNGRHIFTQPTSSLTPHELVRAMIGRDVEHAKRATDGGVDRKASPRISADELTVKNSFGPVDIKIWPGEVVAIVGQLGSGADAILETFAGLRKPAAGKLRADGREIVFGGISDAYRNGIAYVAEDRAGRGVFLTASIEVNITSQILDRISPRGLVSAQLSRHRTLDLARAFAIDPNRVSHLVSTLSGGNQQKVSLAKAAACDPTLLLLNEPTRGVDVGARSEIYARLRQMADAGLAIAFYSTDLEEVMEIADRIVTVYRGKVVRTVERDFTNPDEILRDILHGHLEAVQ
ncbi:sugar ABC transporter ATP-binding protein [Rhizobium sp. Root1204]|uniref:sugar ABC transporter ATP-binding protein n=1 Tax=Rhizobium sp. Root1204 TaxID=1736428 RepID=UPI000B0BD51F|nr:sugar ABC transporter ATP-binding protein [Rhizobium sp. Root1204]